MKQLSLPLLVALAAFILIYDDQKIVSAKSIQKRDDFYTSKYDNVDIDRIVTSKRLMKNYGNCLLDKGPCTPEGKELKMYLPDAMVTKCSKCNAQQKKIAGKILGHLVANYKDLWEQLLQKYDPDGTFRAEYEGTNLEEDYEDDER